MSCKSIWGSENVFLLSLFTDPASIEGFDAETSFLFWTTFRVFGLSCKQIDANWISLECWSWRSFATSVWRISFRESARPSGYKPEHFFFLVFTRVISRSLYHIQHGQGLVLWGSCYFIPTGWSAAPKRRVCQATGWAWTSGARVEAYRELRRTAGPRRNG